VRRPSTTVGSPRFANSWSCPIANAASNVGGATAKRGSARPPIGAIPSTSLHWVSSSRSMRFTTDRR
jgi:hypothetical protein